MNDIINLMGLKNDELIATKTPTNFNSQFQNKFSEKSSINESPMN